MPDADGHIPWPGPKENDLYNAAENHSRLEPELLTALRRWEDAGSTWQIAARTPRSVTMSLCRCDGGEKAERISTQDPGGVQVLAGRRSGPAGAFVTPSAGFDSPGPREEG
jgi:hypothetical protein